MSEPYGARYKVRFCSTVIEVDAHNEDEAEELARAELELKELEVDYIEVKEFISYQEWHADDIRDEEREDK